METVGSRIRELRERKSEERIRDNGTTILFSMRELGDALGVSEKTVEKWEHDQVMLNSKKIVALADFFNVSTDYLLRGGDSENLILMNETGLSNDAINTIKTLPQSHKEALEILLRNKDLLFHLRHYFCGDFTRMTFDVSPPESEERSFSTVDLSSINGLSPSDLDRLERLRLLDELRIARENERGKDE